MKNLLLFAALLISSFVTSAQQLRVASYNIRQENTIDSGNMWTDRKEALCQLIRYHEFDIFGIQEAFHNQLTDMLTLLPAYKHIGKGRDDGKKKGEHSAILYNPQRFQLLKEGTFWLNEKNTDQPLKGWDAAIVRICTWGVFKDLQSEKEFIFMNTHFDHRGKTARIESGKLILAKAKELANGLPIILTGDFNIDEKNEAYLSLANNDVIKDTYHLADLIYEPSATFNGWGKNLLKQQRIDHIFVTPNFSVSKWGVLTDTYTGKYPSDHFPVLSILAW